MRTINNIRNNEVNEKLTNNEIESTRDSISSKIQNIIFWEQKLEVQENNENKHLVLELELAKMFWVEDVSTIENDHKKPMTVADVLSEAEEFWDEYDLIAA